MRLALRPVDGGAQETVSGRYLTVACDGAASPVRKQLGIAQDSLDFEQAGGRWSTPGLATPTPLPPRHPVLLALRGRSTYVVAPARCAAELKLMPGETPEDHADADRLCARLALFVDPEAIELWRVATYRFRALVARHWRRGRIFLAGDAAHPEMPPFLAQGLCSGILDVANLGWKLSEVIAGALPAAILDSYEAERKLYPSPGGDDQGDRRDRRREARRSRRPGAATPGSATALRCRHRRDGAPEADPRPRRPA